MRTLNFVVTVIPQIMHIYCISSNINSMDINIWGKEKQMYLNAGTSGAEEDSGTSCR